MLQHNLVKTMSLKKMEEERQQNQSVQKQKEAYTGYASYLKRPEQYKTKSEKKQRLALDAVSRQASLVRFKDATERIHYKDRSSYISHQEAERNALQGIFPNDYNDFTESQKDFLVEYHQMVSSAYVFENEVRDCVKTVLDKNPDFLGKIDPGKKTELLSRLLSAFLPEKEFHFNPPSSKQNGLVNDFLKKFKKDPKAQLLKMRESLSGERLQRDFRDPAAASKNFRMIQTDYLRRKALSDVFPLVFVDGENIDEQDEVKKIGETLTAYKDYLAALAEFNGVTLDEFDFTFNSNYTDYSSERKRSARQRIKNENKNSDFKLENIDVKTVSKEDWYISMKISEYMDAYKKLRTAQKSENDNLKNVLNSMILEAVPQFVEDNKYHEANEAKKGSFSNGQKDKEDTNEPVFGGFVKVTHKNILMARYVKSELEKAIKDANYTRYRSDAIKRLSPNKQMPKAFLEKNKEKEEKRLLLLEQRIRDFTDLYNIMCRDGESFLKVLKGPEFGRLAKLVDTEVRPAAIDMQRSEALKSAYNENEQWVSNLKDNIAKKDNEENTGGLSDETLKFSVSDKMYKTVKDQVSESREQRAYLKDYENYMNTLKTTKASYYNNKKLHEAKARYYAANNLGPKGFLTLEDALKDLHSQKSREKRHDNAINIAKNEESTLIRNYCFDKAQKEWNLAKTEEKQSYYKSLIGKKDGAYSEEDIPVLEQDKIDLLLRLFEKEYYTRKLKLKSQVADDKKEEDLMKEAEVIFGSFKRKLSDYLPKGRVYPEGVKDELQRLHDNYEGNYNRFAQEEKLSGRLKYIVEHYLQLEKLDIELKEKQKAVEDYKKTASARRDEELQRKHNPQSKEKTESKDKTQSKEKAQSGEKILKSDEAQSNKENLSEEILKANIKYMDYLSTWIDDYFPEYKQLKNQENTGEGKENKEKSQAPSTEELTKALKGIELLKKYTGDNPVKEQGNNETNDYSKYCTKETRAIFEDVIKEFDKKYDPIKKDFDKLAKETYDAVNKEIDKISGKESWADKVWSSITGLWRKETREDNSNTSLAAQGYQMAEDAIAKIHIIRDKLDKVLFFKIDENGEKKVSSSAIPAELRSVQLEKLHTLSEKFTWEELKEIENSIKKEKEGRIKKLSEIEKQRERLDEKFEVPQAVKDIEKLREELGVKADEQNTKESISEQMIKLRYLSSLVFGYNDYLTEYGWKEEPGKESTNLCKRKEASDKIKADMKALAKKYMPELEKEFNSIEWSVEQSMLMKYAGNRQHDRFFDNSSMLPNYRFHLKYLKAWLVLYEYAENKEELSSKKNSYKLRLADYEAAFKGYIDTREDYYVGNESEEKEEVLLSSEMAFRKKELEKLKELTDLANASYKQKAQKSGDQFRRMVAEAGSKSFDEIIENDPESEITTGFYEFIEAAGKLEAYEGLVNPELYKEETDSKKSLDYDEYKQLKDYCETKSGVLKRVRDYLGSAVASRKSFENAVKNEKKINDIFTMDVISDNMITFRNAVEKTDAIEKGYEAALEQVINTRMSLCLKYVNDTAKPESLDKLKKMSLDKITLSRVEFLRKYAGVFDKQIEEIKSAIELYGMEEGGVFYNRDKGEIEVRKLKADPKILKELEDRKNEVSYVAMKLKASYIQMLKYNIVSGHKDLLGRLENTNVIDPDIDNCIKEQKQKEETFNSIAHKYYRGLEDFNPSDEVLEKIGYGAKEEFKKYKQTFEMIDNEYSIRRKEVEYNLVKAGSREIERAYATFANSKFDYKKSSEEYKVLEKKINDLIDSEAFINYSKTGEKELVDHIMEYKDKRLKKLKDHVDYIEISAEMSRKLAEIDKIIINLMAKGNDIMDKDKKTAMKAVQDMVNEALQNAKFRELVKGKNSEAMNMELNFKGKINALSSL